MLVKLLFYARASLIIVALYALISMLYIAQSIIIPLIFSVIISIVLHPFVVFFVSLGLNRITAIVITLFIALLIIAAFTIFYILQGTMLGESIGALCIPGMFLSILLTAIFKLIFDRMIHLTMGLSAWRSTARFTPIKNRENRKNPVSSKYE